MRGQGAVMQKKQPFIPRSRELLHRAQRGDSQARKQLREMGLLYWEHQGHVIVNRMRPLESESSRPVLLAFA